MEPNTTCPSAAAETSPAIVEQDLFSAQAESHLSPPPFPPHPSPELMSEWASGSVLPAMEQEHATSQPLLSPSFPALGEFNMTGGEGGFLTQQEATFPSEGAAFSGFAGQSALLEPNAASAWQNEMPSGSGLLPLPPSIGGGGGSGTGLPSSEYELAPLPESLLMPSMEQASLYNMSSTIGGSLMPWDNCGSSSMGVGSSMSSLQDLTFGAMGAPTLQMQPPLFQGVESFMSSPDMAISAMETPTMQMTPSLNQGVGSFMSSSHDLTIGAMGPPIMPMTHTPHQGVGSSMSSPPDMTIGAMGAPVLQMPPSLPQDIGSSISSQQDLTIGAMVAPVLPMTPSLPVPQGVGSSMSSQDMTIEEIMEAPMLPMTCPLSQGGPNNFSQLTSDAELTPAPASLQAPLLPVKEEPVDNTATARDPVFISLDDEEDELDQDAVPHSVPDNSTGSVQSLSTKLKMLEDLYNIRSMSRGAHKSYMPPRPRSSSTWAGARSTLMSSTWASGARSTQSSSRRAGARSTLLSSTRPGVSSKLLSSTGEGASSHAHIDVNGVLFTDAEMEVLRTDKNMQELVITDTKRVKRTIANRICAARKHALKEMHTLELERQVEALHTKWKEMSIQLQVREMQCAELRAKNMQMGLMMKELERQDMLKDAMTEALEAEIEALKRMNLRSPTSDSGVYGLQH